MRTQKHMRQALFELMREKSVQEITVKELAQRAEISRGTFYLYYDSVQSMVESIRDESHIAYIENAISVLDKGMSFRDSCTELITHPFATDEEFITFVNLVRCHIISREKVSSVVYSIKDEFLKVFTLDTDEWILEYSFQFIAAGITGTIMHWVENSDEAHSFSDIADLILNIFNISRTYFDAVERR